ncbi:3'-5' exoribonuclease YhaM family protein [Alkaliphilus sp. B6464]|uniref:3'-5' exoribonuclease YhaM family protein n=1 Tax=Alkaliphilus sp. B6464 TaxID=2731219 RepID=UPI001BA9D721|nr:HD domain-containing protein [Alkaliphilus sp. B6464]QUH18821.1 HD domain-containing protein [Alkaliphilus sp. B6464]
MSIKQLKDINKSYISQTFETTVLMSDIKVKASKNGKRYADLIIQDSSKAMEAKYWDYEENEEFINSLSPEDAINIKAVVGEYQGQIQITIKQIEKANMDNVNIGDLIPTSNWGIDSMKNGLDFFYEKVKSSHMKKLIDRMIFSSDYFKKFSTHPAARQVHHNFYHGLLQHTLEVLKFGYTVATTKKLSERQIERLIVMTMLHDWAKIIEYKALPSVGFTEEGTMLGHIFLGAHTTLNVINEIEDFDQDDKLIILNGILSHHGHLEFGSPVLPKTVEAQILHQADKMSGDIESIMSFMTDQENEEDTFTTKLWNMGTDYYKKGMK